MQRATIKRRLSALEAAIPVKMPRVAIVLVWPDGHASHDCQDYADIAEAKELISADEFIEVAVIDYSQPQNSAREA